MSSLAGGKFTKVEGAQKAKRLSVLAAAAVLVATLWPMNFSPRNGVTWLSGTNGLKFEKAGIVLSTGVLKPSEPNSQSYTLELLVQPAGITSSQTTLVFYSPKHRRHLEVRQWRDGLLVTHDDRVNSDKTGAIKFDVNHIFHLGKLVCIAVSSGPDGTTVYVNGQLAQSVPTFKISGADLLGEIVLGTSPVRYDPWRGEIQGLAIYAKQLTPEEAWQHYAVWTGDDGLPPDLHTAIAHYTFREAAGTEIHSEVASGPNLRIPGTFSVPYKPFLESPAREFVDNRTYAHDVAMNIGGFVPLGFIICSYFGWRRTRWQAVLSTTLFCATFSFAIEVLQYYIPTRGSGITDILTNTLGAALGALLVRSNLGCRLLQTADFIPPSQNVSQEND